MDIIDTVSKIHTLTLDTTIVREQKLQKNWRIHENVYLNCLKYFHTEQFELCEERNFYG